MSRLSSIALVLATLLPALASAQGHDQYLSLEAPVHRAVATCRVAGEPIVLVCNTPDDAVEVYGAYDLALKARIPTGQRPVTVAVKPTPLADGTVVGYAVNWLGDSVTVFTLAPSLGPGPLQITADVERTVRTGDEPVDITFLPEIASLFWTQPGFVTHEAAFVLHAEGAWWDIRNPFTLEPLAPGLTGLELLDQNGEYAVAEGRALAFSPDQAGDPTPLELTVLNRRGGNAAEYDFDLWFSDDLLSSSGDGRAERAPLGGLGSTNFAMAHDDAGALWVVGGLARNNDTTAFPNLNAFVAASGESLHRDMEVMGTGFVESRLWRVTDVGEPTQSIETLDLNVAGASGGSPLPIGQPTSLVVHDAGGMPRLFVTGFGSDVIGVVEPGAGAPSTWPIIRIDARDATDPFPSYDPLLQELGGRMRGPRAAALLEASQPGEADRLFVLDALANAVTVIDPNFAAANPGSAILSRFDLAADPTPAEVHDGRAMLYSTRLSANGTSSCAVCHIDGDTDQLAWNLNGGGPVNASTVLPGALVPAPLMIGDPAENPGTKGPMVTQTLRGLGTFHARGTDVRAWFTSEPLHWRADIGRFEQFNATYTNLMGFFDPQYSFTSPVSGGLNRGIPEEAMTRFGDFVFSQHVAPNPEQAFDRKPTGALGAPWDATAGTLASRGLKLFHGQPGCFGCHMLPEGSDNIITEAFLHLGVPAPAYPVNHFETAGLRGIAKKNKRLSRYVPGGLPLPVGTTPIPPPAIDPALGMAPFPAQGASTGEFGLGHTGKSTFVEPGGSPTGGFARPTASETIEAFVHGFNLPAADVLDLTRFIREMDTGVSGGVGTTFTVEPALVTSPTAAQILLAIFDAYEAEARAANIGFAIHARMSGVWHGYWFDPATTALPYREIAHGNLPMAVADRDRLALLFSVAPGADVTNRLVLHATPLGSERRMASLDGGPALAPAGPTTPPTNITLLGAETNTAWRDVDDLPGPVFLTGPAPLVQLGIFRTVLVTEASSASPPRYGLPAQARHQAARRFRVSGDGILPGARLRLSFPRASDIADPAQETTPPTTAPGAQHVRWEMPLHAARDDTGNVWYETSVELEARLVWALLCGGPEAPNVQQVLDDPTDASLYDPTSGQLDTASFRPRLWNWFHVEIVQDVTTSGGPVEVVGSGGWQRLSVN